MSRWEACLYIYFGESLRNIRNTYTHIFPIVCVLSSRLSGPWFCRGGGGGGGARRCGCGLTHMNTLDTQLIPWYSSPIDCACVRALR